MEKLSPHQLILKTLKEKASMKQDVYAITLLVFIAMKATAKKIVSELKKETADKRVVIEFKDKDEFEFEIRIAGDLLIFVMHTNIFDFDKAHPVWRNSYLKEDNTRAFCGMITIYNFLNDSFIYNRVNDLGYMVGRVFVNKENHYFVEGKRQLGFLYNDFVNAVIDEQSIRSILESTILYSINFDLLTPPFDSVKEISVSDIQSASENLQVKTGKRLGFRFKADTDEID